MCSAFRAEEALPFLNKAIDIAKSSPEPDWHLIFNVDRFLRNRGRVYQQLGQFNLALVDFEEAEVFQLKRHGEDSHYDGE